MVYNGIIEGKTIYMKSADADDAEFIVGIRNDKNKNKFVHSVENDISLEIQWIENQRNRKGDYFFSIFRKSDDTLLGNVSIYNIESELKCGELGRWVSYGTAVESLETILLLHDFAFSVLGIEQVYTKTLSENISVVNFWHRFGGNGETKSIDGMSYYCNYIMALDYENTIRKKNEELLAKVVKND